jgi:hypothetical protein
MNLPNDPTRPVAPANGTHFTTATLALSAFLLLTGGVLLLPFALSPNAIQNDVYMANLFLLPLFVIGSIVFLLVGVLRNFRVPAERRAPWPWARALLLAVVGAAAVVGASFLVGGQYASVPAGDVYWPPYLNGWLLAVIALIGVAVAVAGWVWGTGESRGERRRVGAV